MSPCAARTIFLQLVHYGGDGENRTRVQKIVLYGSTKFRLFVPAEADLSKKVQNKQNAFLPIS